MTLLNGDSELIEGNRYYWNLSNILNEMADRNTNNKDLIFKLNGSIWKYVLFFRDDDEFYYGNFQCYQNNVYKSVNTLTGIVNDKEEEVVDSKPVSNVKLISRSALQQLLSQRQILYIFMQIDEKDKINLKKKASKEAIAKQYRDLLLSGKNSDVILDVQGTKFYCHKCILGARSPTFSVMLTDLNGGTTLSIEDTDSSTFKQFLLYLYTGNEDYLNFQNVDKLFKLGQKFAMEEVKDICRHDIVSNFFRFNCLELLKITLRVKDVDLDKNVVSYFLRHKHSIYHHLRKSEDSWITIDFLMENINIHNIFLFIIYSESKEEPELTKCIIQFFLRDPSAVIASENWSKFQKECDMECLLLIKALAEKK